MFWWHHGLNVDANIDYHFIQVQILTTMDVDQLQLVDAALYLNINVMQNRLFLYIITSSNYFVTGIFDHESSIPDAI